MGAPGRHPFTFDRFRIMSTTLTIATSTTPQHHNTTMPPFDIAQYPLISTYLTNFQSLEEVDVLLKPFNRFLEGNRQISGPFQPLRAQSVVRRAQRVWFPVDPEPHFFWNSMLQFFKGVAELNSIDSQSTTFGNDYHVYYTTFGLIAYLERTFRLNYQRDPEDASTALNEAYSEIWVNARPPF